MLHKRHFKAVDCILVWTFVSVFECVFAGGGGGGRGGWSLKKCFILLVKWSKMGGGGGGGGSHNSTPMSISSEWFFTSVYFCFIFYQSFFVSVVFSEVCLPQIVSLGDLSSECFFIKVVFHSVVSHHCGLSPRWYFINGFSSE